jgi:hypothetical protein
LPAAKQAGRAVAQVMQPDRRQIDVVDQLGQRLCVCLDDSLYRSYQRPTIMIIFDSVGGVIALSGACGCWW